MATNTGQYAPVFLPGELPSLTEKPGRLQSTRSQRVGHYRSDPACTDARHLFPVAALPQSELSMKVVQLLGLQGPWQRQVCRNTDCLHCRSSGPIRVFSQASCGWRSENLFGRSFFIAPPVLVLRGLPCLGSFSVVPHSRHLEGPPTQLGSYSVYWYIRHLKGYHGWGPAL